MFSYNFEFHPIKSPSGAVLAFADLVIEDSLKVVGFKIMKNSKTGELWVAPPQEKSDKLDDQGQPKYFPRVYWTDSKEKEEDYRTRNQDEVYNEMVKAYTASSQAQTRQGAAKQHANRNDTSGGSRDVLWQKS